MTAERRRKHADEETSEEMCSIRATERKQVREEGEETKTLQPLASLYNVVRLNLNRHKTLPEFKLTLIITLFLIRCTL